MKFRTLVCSLALLTVDNLAVFADSYEFVEIQFPGAGETIAKGVASDGTVVGTYGNSLDVREPIENGRTGFIWNPVSGDFQSISAFGSPATNANSINDSGLVVGDYFTNNRLRGFVFDPVANEYTSILPPDVNADEATISDIADDGVLIGSYSTNRSLSQPNPENLQVFGFRAFPQLDGSFVYETFEVSFSTSTYAGSRNSAGTEVGMGVEQGGLGTHFFGFKQPTEEFFDFPSSMLANDEQLLQTSLTAINDNDVILGNAQIQKGSGFSTSVVNRSFLMENNEGGLQPATLETLALPCPDCESSINILELRVEEPGKSIATNISDSGLIVGFNDDNDGIYSGFLGIPLPETGLLGDFDVDNDVDGFDFLAWQRGESPAGLSRLDLLGWIKSYGQNAPSFRVENLSVPEPGTLILATSYCLMGLLGKSRRLAE